MVHWGGGCGMQTRIVDHAAVARPVLLRRPRCVRLDLGDGLCEDA